MNDADKMQEAFEAWFEQWRVSTWRPLPSDERKECPKHWATNPKMHMKIGWQAATAQQAERIKDLEAQIAHQRAMLTSRSY